ncbi:FG-GAP-like repeat-containing protein [Nocardioides sp.]|uniref:FG-GAP-like repeat-containing protein n=1 Tax=Nocardioides sp. TaxID=35761 RepID=UPI00286D242E|nr:FG-GAP-like repeat-containing protein [Nocardioides sp.]
MPTIKARFVTACQQLLALGLVLAALTPAANLVSLDVVQREQGADQPVSVLAAYARSTTRTSVVPVGVVDPLVREVALTAPSTQSGRRAAGSLQARVVAGRDGGSELVSTPQPVTGYGAVGVTWEHGVDVPESDIAVQVRTETAGAWTAWMPVQYDADHGPDPQSDEARHARPGTDALLVGDVDGVQVRVSTPDGPAPADLRLAVIDPGQAEDTAVERPAIDTRELDSAASETATPAAYDTMTVVGEGAQDTIDLRAAAFTPKPVIYSRAQWGADERMRDEGPPSYFEVHAGFVHHTVNANDYSQAEVPGLLRSIYAYHTKSRGWSDIGYNYLVDRFGRIWEGRAGGVDRPVVGAHTLGYNDYSFAMSAIGNFDTAQAPAVMVQAYGALFAWKLSLHGVDASSPRQVVGRSSFQAISGHRDADSTACPGRHLYAKIGRIRELAAAAQRGWSGRELESDLASTPHPDLIVRSASDKMGYVLPTGGLTSFEAARNVATGVGDVDTVVASPDLTGDGSGDLLVRSTDGEAGVMPGTGSGGFGAVVQQSTAFAGHDLVTAVGDLDLDGDNDLVARDTATGRLDAYLGTGTGGFVRQPLRTGWADYDLLVGASDVDGDGEVDLIAREAGTGRTWLHRGSNGIGFSARTALAPTWKQFDTVTGLGDFTSDRVPDLFVRRADNQLGYVLPGRGGGVYGHPLGPIVRTKGVSDITGASLSGTPAADLVARRGTSLVLLQNTGAFDLGQPIPTGVDLASADLVLNAGDWDRDGKGDMITRNKANGGLFLRLGDGEGGFGKVRALASGFGSVGLLAAVGDMTGDGWPDLMGQPAGGDMRIYPGSGTAGLGASYVAYRRIDASQQIPVGRHDTDGAPDLLFRTGTGLRLYPGNGPGGLTTGPQLGLDLAPYDWVVGISDIGLVGHGDLLVRDKRFGFLYVVPMTPSGFGPRRFLAEGMKDYDLAG